jgi:uncharacterized membrane protein
MSADAWFGVIFMAVVGLVLFCSQVAQEGWGYTLAAWGIGGGFLAVLFLLMWWAYEVLS